LLLTFVIPRFQQVFEGMLGPGQKLPTFTLIVMGISNTVKNHIIMTAIGVVIFVILFFVVY